MVASECCFPAFYHTGGGVICRGHCRDNCQEVCQPPPPTVFLDSQVAMNNFSSLDIQRTIHDFVKKKRVKNRPKKHFENVSQKMKQFTGLCNNCNRPGGGDGTNLKMLKRVDFCQIKLQLVLNNLFTLSSGLKSNLFS